MLISNKDLRIIIRKSISESLNRNNQNFLLEAEGMFTSDKNTKPGDQLSFGTSNKSFQVLAKSKQERLSKEYYVLALWPTIKTPDKMLKGLPEEAWRKDLFGLFHDGGYSADHAAKIGNIEWLIKNYYYPMFGYEWKENDPKSNIKALSKSGKLRRKILGRYYEDSLSKTLQDNMKTNKHIINFAKNRSPFVKKYAGKIKTAFKQGRVAAISTDFLQSNKEFKTALYKGGTLKDYALDTAVPTVAAVGELLAVLALTNPVTAPLSIAFKGVSDSANMLDAYRKLSTGDFLGCGLALIGLVPGIGDSVTIIGNAASKIGAKAASKLVGTTILKELIEILFKILDGDLVDTFKEIVQAFANSRKINTDNFLKNVREALTTFKASLETYGKFGKEKVDFAHAVGVAHGDVATKGLSTKPAKNIKKGIKAVTASLK